VEERVKNFSVGEGFIGLNTKHEIESKVKRRRDWKTSEWKRARIQLLKS